ncbi:uncharacterized protein Triagg1_8662 [Trichoderma aggressivum f. europaeum]|uniref:Prion-inhibition and propagation HeLo domain-containing protein n=1 Tax=Trichoderma aggressivum f. europaeum TaxID=173218 RepID=A0AAE1I7Y8_9HYPO|nr:hypothetical protein Triagg1_8662 [Trichoderma aggressivum f. europaeum]
MHQCFIRIQQARAFEQEFRRYQQRLQVQLNHCLRLIQRMERAKNFSATIAIDGLEITQEEGERSIMEMLSDTRDALRKAKREAAEIQAGLTTTALQLQDANSNTTLNLKTMQVRVTGFLDKRKVQAAKTIEAMKWVFYKRDICNKLIADIALLMNDLERQVASDTRIIYAHCTNHFINHV